MYLVIGAMVWSVSKLFCRKIRKQDRPSHLSLPQALEKADRLKLFKVKRDPATHLPIQGTQRRFKFLDQPETVGLESVGLGFYFYHLNMFVVILVVLSLAYCINIAQYYNRMEFEEFYTLKFDSVGSAMSTNRTCDRPYNTHTLITRLSAGSLCVEGGSSNPYFCPALCTVTLRDDESVNLRDPTLCKRHKPCGHNLNSTMCCSNALDTENGHFPFLSIWMCIFSIIIFSGWITYNRIMSNKLGMRLNSSVITASDYTVLVSGLNPKVCTRDQLIWFFSHFGSISWCTVVPRIGAVLEKKDQLGNLKEMEKEIDLHSEETLNTVSVSGILFMLSYFGLPFFLRASFFGVRRAITARKEWIARRMTALEGEIQKAEARAVDDIRSDRNTGQALITYEYEKFSKNAFNDQNRPIAKAFGKNTCNLVPVSRYPKFQDRTIRVERAPEPSDFRWENTNTFGYRQSLRVLTSNFGMLLVLLIGALIQLQLEVWKAEALDDYAEFKVATADDRDEKKYLMKQFRVRSLSMSSSIAIVIVNMCKFSHPMPSSSQSIANSTFSRIFSLSMPLCVMLVMHVIAGALSSFERWHSWSDTEKYLLLKLSIAYFLNTSVIPLLASTRKNWYTEGGFAEQVFYTQLIDAVMAPILAMFDPTWLCSRLSCQYAKTQGVLDKILVPPEFSLSIRYSDTIKTLSMAVIFAPMVPTSPMIGLIGT